MPTPTEFMRRYRNLSINAVIEDPTSKICRSASFVVQITKYFMMDWTDGTEERRDYDTVTRGPKKDAWFDLNRERIRSAAMGKGAPQDYQLALAWAVRSKKITTVTQASLQAYSDEHLGIDCSGFVTNYLVANGKKTYSSDTVRNTSAASYYSAANAINDPGRIQRGDLLVWMDGNSVKSNPGHVAVVESYVPQSLGGGNMRVVEATGASGANPKLLDSMYAVERIIPKGGAVPSMILVVKRHGVSGSRVAVMRV